MSTLLVVGVVVAAIVGVLRIALNELDQPPTIRRPRRRGPPPAAGGTPMSIATTLSGSARARLGPVDISTPTSARVRSGLVLVMLLTLVGAFLALAVGATLVLVALVLRGAVS